VEREEVRRDHGADLGVFAVLSGLVQNFTQLLIVRFLLGVAEGGIWPAILVLISHWFPARERARAYGFWMMNIAIARSSPRRCPAGS
jgi:MFS family permease